MIISNVILALGIEQLWLPFSGLETLVLLYVGPDQILPLASALGAILGILLMVWNHAVGLVRKLWQSVSKKRADSGLKSGAPRVTVEPARSIREVKVDQAG